ncbi:MAG TPA: MG2 domain-containing protein, partial [Pirellulales bacterium]
LSALPDYTPGWNYGSQSTGAPVDAEGNPVFYREVKTFDAAANDGERWRWALLQTVEYSPARLNETRMLFAAFLRQEFGVQTLRQYSIILPTRAENADPTAKDNPFALHTLKDEETIARLATGVKRLTLPDEFNFIKIYQKVAAEPQTGFGDHALSGLAGAYTDRRQFTKAAETWKQCIATYGNGPNNLYKQSLDQIIGNWGRFEDCNTFPAGKGPELLFRFRNGEKLELEAHEIKVAELLADVKAYLKSSPRELDWQRLNIDNIGYRLVEQNQTKYVGAKAASWVLDLKPRPEHEDAEVSISTPLQKAGAYLVTAKMKDGNVSRIVVWVNDTIIVKKRLGGEVLYYIADAVTGAPIAKANLELFGYRQRYENNRWKLDSADFAEFSDASGQVILGDKDLSHEFTWLAMARTPEGRFAFLGFSGVWYQAYDDLNYDQVKVFAITDCPVYRPKAPVKFKLWVARARYDQANKSQYAGSEFNVHIVNSKGDKVYESKLKADEFGGVAGEWPIPEDATLGQYMVHIPEIGGGGSFRIEEYKKPEFQVTVEAPSEPVALGEKITAKIQAKYYFGSPVVEATVKYKVLRTAYTQRWYPIGPWDWLYGRGYGWTGADCYWYPGWERWGHGKPFPWWIGMNHAQPEVVAELETPIGKDGTLSVEIDTAVAQAIHADEDHRYEITAEVVDQSRRTIVGSGAVLVARKPFDVVVWSDRGYLRAGDAFTAFGAARTLNEKPVAGTAKLTLFKVNYDKNGVPTEEDVQSWDVQLGADGEIRQQITAAEPGQYRLALVVTDGARRTVEGGAVLTVLGQQSADDDFRFNDVEISSEKSEYAAGETAKLLIAANRPNSTVLLFPRPSQGVYRRPKFLHLKGKTTVEEVAVGVADMPNFFMEVLTIANGRVYTEMKEILVPPAKKVLNVEVVPSAATFTPGQDGKIVVKVTDSTGEPFVGSTVVSMYDKSLEY